MKLNWKQWGAVSVGRFFGQFLEFEVLGEQITALAAFAIGPLFVFHGLLNALHAAGFLEKRFHSLISVHGQVALIGGLPGAADGGQNRRRQEKTGQFRDHCSWHIHRSESHLPFALKSRMPF